MVDGKLGYLKITDDINKMSIMRSTKASGYVWDFYTYALKLRIEENLKKEENIDINLEYKDYLGENSEENYIKYKISECDEIKLRYKDNKYDIVIVNKNNEEITYNYKTEIETIKKFKELVKK